MKGRIIKDWSRVNMESEADRRKVYGALNHFMQCNTLPEVKQAIQHFATQGDFPASVLEVIEKYHLVSDFDNAWQALFDERDFTSSQRDGFKISNVGSGLTFSEVQRGGSAKIYKFAGELVTVNFAMYGGGLGWHRTLFDDREYWTIEDNAIAFRNSFFRDKAAVYYALIEALTSGQNTTWQNPTPSALANTDPNYTAIRDANTINSAILSVLTDCKDKGYGLSANTPFGLLAPLALRPRITRALGLLNQSLAGDQRGVQYNVLPQYTLMLSSQSSYYVGAKGIKTIAGNRMNLTTFDKFDPESYSDIAVGWARFGGAIGDVQLIRRCATS